LAIASGLERKQVYNLKFRPKEIQMMDYILALLEEVEDVGVEEEDTEEDGEGEDDDGEEDGEEDEDEQEGDEERDQPSFPLPSGPSLKLSEALFQLSMMFWTY
jgi:hypothetical protein